MNIGTFIPKFISLDKIKAKYPYYENYTNFGQRLASLIIYSKMRNSTELAEQIFENRKKSTDYSYYLDMEKGKEDYKSAVDSIRKVVDKHIKQDVNVGIIQLNEYCLAFSCSADYFLGYIDFPTHKTQNVYETTGLNEKALHELDMIRLTDRNENSITLFPSELFAKMYSNEKLTPEEQKQVEEIFFDTSDKYMSPLDSHRPLLMDLLNYMLASGNIEKIIIQFRNFVNARFKVPVYYDNDKGNFIYPDNAYSYTGDTNLGGKIYKGNYILNFASSPDNPNDNAPISLSDTFFDMVILKDIEKIFYEMRTDYKKEYGD